jgi:phage terminase small subunit
MADNGRPTGRQMRFITAYLTAPTIAEAAKAAKIGERTAYKYLNDPRVKAEMERRQEEAVKVATARLAALSGEALAGLREALALLRDHAGADAADFITVDEVTGQWSLDLVGAEAAGRLHLIRKLWEDAQGHHRLELHDPQAAAARLGRLALDILEARRKAAELEELAERVAALEEKIA